MRIPKKPKYRKQQKQVRHIKGRATRGANIDFGDFAIRALEGGWITSRQIEAARIAATRHVKRGGKLFIRIFPHKPLSKKPAETRMGSGKGAPEQWVAEVREGKVLFELTGVSKAVAMGALKRAAAKLPLVCKIESRTDYLV